MADAITRPEKVERVEQLATETQEAQTTISRAQEVTPGTAAAPERSENEKLKLAAGAGEIGVSIEAKLNQARDASRDVIRIPPEQEVRFDALKPNAVYEKNGYVYHTDDQRRPISVQGKLKLEPGDRSPQQTEIGHQGRETDHGGHLIATRFDGPPDGFNIVPQDASLNWSLWKAMENEWARALRNGKPVEVDIGVTYGDNSMRPKRFVVKYKIDGRQYKKSFMNGFKGGTGL